ncbi:type VI secretion protein [Burkholderia sp. SRS-46]|nr:type VI secretion protein [Burkholderia sp. SRS-46]
MAAPYSTWSKRGMTMTIPQSPDVSETRARDSGLQEPMPTLLKRQVAAGPVGYVTIGRVGETALDGAWWVATEPGGEPRLARTAVSCLVKPQPDDLVQLYLAAGGCWVLAILERRGDAASVALDFGKASVLLQAHDVRVQAHDRLDLEAAHIASRAEVVTQAAAERHAHVSGTDAMHAGNTFIHTERHLGVHAQSAVVTADALLKMDAGQIHMG